VNGVWAIINGMVNVKPQSAGASSQDQPLTCFSVPSGFLIRS